MWQGYVWRYALAPAVFATAVFPSAPTHRLARELQPSSRQACAECVRAIAPLPACATSEGIRQSCMQLPLPIMHPCKLLDF